MKVTIRRERLGVVTTLGSWSVTTIGRQGPAGPQGEPGAGLNPMGAWDAGVTYQAPDLVEHGGSAYYTLSESTGEEPPGGPWVLLVERGSDGADGADSTVPGPKGDTGDAGPAGAAATVTVGDVTTGAPGSSADVTNVGTSAAAVLNFTIPRGDTGAAGADGNDGAAGSDGREVELRTNATHIQWRYEGAGSWTDLVALADLEGPQGPAGSDGSQGPKGADGADGREVELQVTGTHIQWRLDGDSWTNLIALSDLEGPPGTPGTPGAPGVGVPAGGSTGQVLKKASGADFDTEWVAQSGGGASAWGDLTGNLSDQADLQNALNAKADASSLATVATSGDYTDLSNRPTLGSAAAANTGDFATAAQGGKADNAVQPGDELTDLASTGATAGHVPKADGSGGIAWAAESGGGGGGIDPGDGVVVVTHGSNANETRPTAGIVYWIGSVAPTNRQTGDLWLEV